MNLKILAILGLIVAGGMALSACNLYKKSSSTNNQNQAQTGASSPQPAVAGQGVVITLTDNGFEPENLTVKTGQIITWVNNTSGKVQIGSDPHPVHTTNQELTNGEFVTDLEPGASVNVTLNKVGAWGFHDHLNPSVKGKVTVQ